MGGTVDCPKCSTPFHVDIVAAVGNDQRFQYRVVPIEGNMMQAEAIGAQLVALDKVFKSIARQDGGRVRCYIEKCSMDDEGAITFDIAVLAVKRIGDAK